MYLDTQTHTHIMSISYPFVTIVTHNNQQVQVRTARIYTERM